LILGVGINDFKLLFKLLLANIIYFFCTSFLKILQISLIGLKLDSVFFSLIKFLAKLGSDLNYIRDLIGLVLSFIPI